MIANRLRLVLFASGLAACVALALFLHASRLRAASLREQIATLRQMSPAGSITPAATGAEERSLAATEEQRELAEWAALLEAARRIPELARREATLRVVRRIQAEHTARPPPPRPLPPPEPRDSPYFVELLDDPEYLQLVAQRWRIGQGVQTEQQLARLDVPQAVRNKILELEFDTYTALLDVQRYSRDDAGERGAATAASQKVRAENDTAIKQLLGDDAFAAYRDPTAAGAIETRSRIDSIFEPLARRLSYSAAPLDPATRTRLTELLQSLSSSPSALYALPRTPEFINRARAILQPAQVAALDELRVESEAVYARSRLPKSSELPRAKRHQRLESASN
jgi:hypothetical protein